MPIPWADLIAHLPVCRDALAAQWSGGSPNPSYCPGPADDLGNQRRWRWGLSPMGEPMIVLALAFIATFIFVPGSYDASGFQSGPSPYTCTASGAGMQATCKEKSR